MLVDTELELGELSTRSATPTLINPAELELGEFSDLSGYKSRHCASDLSVAALGVAPTAYRPECSSMEVVAAETAAANSSNSTAMRVLCQVDGGSNAHLLSNAGAAVLCRLSPAQGMIGGIAGGLEYNAVALGEVSFAGVGQNCSLSFLYTPGEKKDILSESALLDTYEIEARKHPPRLIFCDGSKVAMIRKNGLFYVWVEFNGLAAQPGSVLEQHAAADEPRLPLAPQPGELSERDYTVAAQPGEYPGLGQPAVSAVADSDPEGPGPSGAPLEMAINAPTYPSGGPDFDGSRRRHEERARAPFGCVDNARAAEIVRQCALEGARAAKEHARATAERARAAKERRVANAQRALQDARAAEERAADEEHRLADARRAHQHAAAEHARAAVEARCDGELQWCVANVAAEPGGAPVEPEPHAAANEPEQRAAVTAADQPGAELEQHAAANEPEQRVAITIAAELGSAPVEPEQHVAANSEQNAVADEPEWRIAYAATDEPGGAPFEPEQHAAANEPEQRVAITIAAKPGSAPVEPEQYATADELPPPLAPQPGELSEREVNYTVAAQLGEFLGLGQPAVSAPHAARASSAPAAASCGPGGRNGGIAAAATARASARTTALRGQSGARAATAAALAAAHAAAAYADAARGAACDAATHAAAVYADAAQGAACDATAYAAAARAAALAAARHAVAAHAAAARRRNTAFSAPRTARGSRGRNSAAVAPSDKAASAPHAARASGARAKRGRRANQSPVKCIVEDVDIVFASVADAQSETPRELLGQANNKEDADALQLGDNFECAAAGAAAESNDTMPPPVIATPAEPEQGEFFMLATSKLDAVAAAFITKLECARPAPASVRFQIAPALVVRPRKHQIAPASAVRPRRHQRAGAEHARHALGARAGDRGVRARARAGGALAAR